MKKTLIAASIAALAAGSAQAVTLYESETGSFSSYGKVQLQLNNFDGENEIQNNGSRFGFHGESALDHGLTAFANAEFRFNAGFQHEAEMTVRNSFVGVRGDFGTVRAGNFDSIYYTGVSNVLDVMEQDGYRALVTDSTNARGFSLAYETGDLGGFAFGLGVKHFNSAESRNGAGYPSYSGPFDDDGIPVAGEKGDQEWNVQAYAQFTMIENLVLAVAVDQNNEDAAGGIRTSKPSVTKVDNDPIIGFSATYTLDALTASALVETAGDLTHFGVAANYNLGAANVYGLVSWLDNGDKDGVDFALGANYSLSSNFMVYGEFAMGNDDNSSITRLADRDAVGSEKDEGVASITLGAAYRW